MATSPVARRNHLPFLCADPADCNKRPVASNQGDCGELLAPTRPAPPHPHPADCNKLFIACEACRTHYNGCCCSECLEAPRLLRPAKTAGQYGTWRECGGNEEVS